MNDVTHTRSPEWHNENELRAYPLEDDCRASEAVPPWLVTDIRVSVGREYDTVFLSSAYLSATLVSVAICGSSGGGSPVGLLARTVTRDELAPGRAYAFDSIDGRSCGTVVFGRIPDDAVTFKLSFSGDEAPLAANAVVRVRRPGVVRIVDRAHGASASGVIDLSGNSEFRTYRGPAGEIVIELTDMYRDATTSTCSASPSYDNCGETPVSSINGVTPDEEGVLRLKFR